MAEVKEVEGRDEKGERKSKLMNSSDELCTSCLGTEQLFVSFGHCLCRRAQTTEWGEALEGLCVPKRKATGDVCTDIPMVG